MKNLFRNKYFKIIAPIVTVLVVALAVILVVDPWGAEPYPPSTSIENNNPPQANDADPDDPPSDSEPTPSPTPLPPPTDPNIFNPLTGVLTHTDISRNRPVAIMLSNVPEALPMNGVSQADIIYEVLVEGGLTRMLAIFQDFSNVGTVGSIRSSRHYYVEIVHGYDAIYLHAGGSPLAFNMISELNIDGADEVRGTNGRVFRRDRGRVSGRRFQSLHSVITSGELAQQWFPEFDFRLEHEADFQHTLLFTDDPIPTDGSPAQDVVVRFSGAKTSSFAFDQTNNVYHLNQFNRDFIDANNDEVVAFTNLLVLRTRVSSLTGSHGGSGRQDMDTVGEGQGYFVSNGRVVEIMWSRPDTASPFTYTLLDGTIIELGRGSTYIGIVPLNANISFN